MKRILIAFLLCLFVNEVNGQAFLNESDYLNSRKISTEAKLLYQHKIRLYDNDTFQHCLDSLFTQNDLTRPFYILLASRIISKADGMIAEMIFGACVNLFEKKSDALVEFLYSDNKLTNRYKEDWAYAIARGAELNKSENTKQYTSKMRPLVYKRTKQKNKVNLEDFYSRIYKESD